MAMWIDASDEVPMDGQNVLVICNYDGHIEYNIGCYEYEKWWGVIEESSHIPVTHWQPLPSAPSERKPKPQTARTCGACKNWEHGSCNLPRSPRFTDPTSATDGCTPNKKARADWI